MLYSVRIGGAACILSMLQVHPCIPPVLPPHPAHLRQRKVAVLSDLRHDLRHLQQLLVQRGRRGLAAQGGSAGADVQHVPGLEVAGEAAADATTACSRQLLCRTGEGGAGKDASGGDHGGMQQTSHTETLQQNEAGKTYSSTRPSHKRQPAPVVLLARGQAPCRAFDALRNPNMQQCGKHAPPHLLLRSP